MRTATTLARTKDGWVLVSGPGVPADKQRTAFNNARVNWPKDWLEVRFQLNDGAAKTRIPGESHADLVSQAHKRADEKLEAAKRTEKERAEAAKKEAEAIQKKAADENTKAIADKEAAKKKAIAEAKAAEAAKEVTHPQITKPK